MAQARARASRSLLCFPELHDGEIVLSNSVVLTSQLLLASRYLAKIWFILEDCTREGTRLWMLTKSLNVIYHRFGSLVYANDIKSVDANVIHDS
ncbi:hypothetical protein M0R45_014965 [Rubus argutus]|uniref:Uncharacterized protein n=1 Tax=Rubus argutus TaxID=59490 RepID=A0AAW1XNR3_RUBAR